MKYSREHLERAESYSARIGLSPRLISISRTKLQADTLLDVQIMCEIHYKADYSTAIDNDIANPQRKQDKALRDIDTIKKYLYDHHMVSELEMIAQLTELENRLNIDNRENKPNMIFDGAIAEITEQLEDAGFKDTNINEDILPIFGAMIKSTLFYSEHTS